MSLQGFHWQDLPGTPSPVPHARPRRRRWVLGPYASLGRWLVAEALPALVLAACVVYVVAFVVVPLLAGAVGR